MNWLKTWSKNIWNLVPSFIGIIQSVLPPLKEVVVAVVRLIAILPIWWSTPDPIIKKVNAIYDAIYKWIEKIKNMTLFVS